MGHNPNTKISLVVGILVMCRTGRGRAVVLYERKK